MDQQMPQMAAPQQPQPKSNKGLILGIVAALVILALIGVIVFMYTQANKTREDADQMRESADEMRQSADQIRDNAGAAQPSSAGSGTQPASASQPATTPQQTSTKPAAQQPAPAPVVTAANFKGEWNGSYTGSSLAGKNCQKSGAISLSVNSTGSVTGYAMISSAKLPGTGTIDSNGNLSGSWSYGDLKVTYSGKLNYSTNKGSGSYRDAAGCFGTFSVTR